MECQSIELELGSMAKSSSWYFANISKTFRSTKKSCVHLSVGGCDGPWHAVDPVQGEQHLKQLPVIVQATAYLLLIFCSCRIEKVWRTSGTFPCCNRTPPPEISAAGRIQHSDLLFAIYWSHCAGDNQIFHNRTCYLTFHYNYLYIIKIEQLGAGIYILT